MSSIRCGLSPLRGSLSGRSLSRLPAKQLQLQLQQQQHRTLASTRTLHGKNQIYDSVRRPGDFQTYLSLSSSSRTPLATLFTTSYCPACKTVLPLLESLVSSGVGEAEGGIAFCEVQYDAPDILAEGLGMTYMITSVPTLLSFDAGEAQIETKVTDGRLLANKEFLENWIRREAQRRGNRGGGGGGGGFSLGGLFGSWR